MSTAFRRSSNSPRYFAPAISEPMSSAITRRSRSDSGTSPETIRWARPSTIAVLPTPGSPISTGLFLVRRERTWITRRISSSRPITGSSLPCSATCGQVAAEALERLVLLLGALVGDAVGAAHLGERLQQPLAVGADGAQRSPGGRRCSREREQQVLGRDVVVAELARPRRSARAQHVGQVCRGLGALARDAGAELRQLLQRAVELVGEGFDVDAELGQHAAARRRLASRRLTVEPSPEQAPEQVRGDDLRVARAPARAARPRRAPPGT